MIALGENCRFSDEYERRNHEYFHINFSASG